MNKVYLVTVGDYSDYNVFGVFTDIEIAEKLVDTIGSSSRLEIYGLNEHANKIEQGLRPYIVGMNSIGNTSYVSIREDGWASTRLSYEHYAGRTIMLRHNVWARHDEHAVKATNEIRTQLLALNLWPRDDEVYDASHIGDNSKILDPANDWLKNKYTLDRVVIRR
jgi:hypothetical protein